MGEPAAQLKRSIRLPSLIFYGLGTMVGGGFYALLGEVSSHAGMHTPLAFGLAGLLALISAFSFAELAARYPYSAGEARYVEEGFRLRSLAGLVGWLVVLTGVVSAAALSVATIGFLNDLVPVPNQLGVVVLVLCMGLIAAWGVGQSVALVTVITLIEIGALVVVCLLAGDSLGHLPERVDEIVLPRSAVVWTGIFAGGFLAFYAFIGFEDMVNMAEEVTDARKTLPKALIVCVILTTLIYVVVATIAVLKTDPADLAASRTPLAELVRGHGRLSTTGIGIVSVLTGLNGALVQIVMASRVIYGMAQRGQAPQALMYVHPRRQTPIRATLLVALIVLLLATLFPLATLARWTSAIILVIFALVNLSLWIVRGRDKVIPEGAIRVPRWLPLVGCLCCAGVLGYQLWLALGS